MNKIKVLLLLLIIVLLGGALRIYKLDFQSLWVDELATLRRAEVESVSNIIYMAETIDIHPPGIYIIYYYWLKIFSNSEFNFRLLSAIAGILSIIAVYVLAKKLYSEKEGLISAVLVAVSWFPIYYSQEARPYSLLLLFSILSTLFYWQIVKQFLSDKNTSVSTYVLYILSAVITIYLHYFGTYLIFLQGVFLFFISMKTKKYFFKWLTAYLIIFISYLPWIPSMAAQFRGGVGTGIYSAPNFEGILDYLYYINNNSRLIFILTIFIMLIAWLSFIRNNTKNKSSQFKSLSGETTFLLLWFFIPLICIIVLSHAVRPVFSYKNMIITYAAFPILISRLIVNSRFSDLIKTIIVISFVSILLYNLIYHSEYYQKPTKEQFREVVQHVIKHYDNETDADILALTYAREYFDYYFQKFNSNLKVDECIQLENNDDKIEKALSRCKSKYLWLINAHQIPDRRIKNMIDRNYSLVKHKSFIKAGAALYFRKDI